MQTNSNAFNHPSIWKLSKIHFRQWHLILLPLTEDLDLFTSLHVGKKRHLNLIFKKPQKLVCFLQLCHLNIKLLVFPNEIIKQLTVYRLANNMLTGKFYPKDHTIKFFSN